MLRIRPTSSLFFQILCNGPGTCVPGLITFFFKEKIALLKSPVPFFKNWPSLAIEYECILKGGLLKKNLATANDKICGIKKVNTVLVV
ncbi:hypothetical protein GIB67_019699, partial [Kingdonia uniflora]